MSSFEGEFEPRDLRSKMNKEQLAQQEAIYKAAAAAEKARQEQEKAKEEAEVASAVKGGALDLRAFHKQLAAKEAAEKRKKVTEINKEIHRDKNPEIVLEAEARHKTAEMKVTPPPKKSWWARLTGQG